MIEQSTALVAAFCALLAGALMGYARGRAEREGEQDRWRLWHEQWHAVREFERSLRRG